MTPNLDRTTQTVNQPERPAAAPAQWSAPATEAAQAWQGHRYGLQAMKPAIEPIICFQKPYAGKPVDCIVRTGAGALNVDAGRIGAGAKKWESPRGLGFTGGGTDNGPCASIDNEVGRWPSNFTLDEEAARRLDLQSGTLTSGTGAIKGASSAGYNGSAYGAESRAAGTPMDSYGDTGGASRFFHVSDWNAEVEERLFDSDPVRYVAKADRTERNEGCSHLAAREWIDGAAVPNREIRPNRPNPNNHPTVKPIALTTWLAKLLLPPDSYAPRRLLVPFSGSGSEMIGAARAGWDECTGIEGEAGHVAIAEARLRHHIGLFVSP